MKAKLVLLVLVLAALGLAVIGCGGDDDEGDATTTATSGVTEYVGTIDGVDPAAEAAAGDYFVAVTVSDSGAVIAYACDGKGNSGLFEGQLDGDSFELDSEDGDATMTATVSSGEAEGELEIGGETLAFSATPAKGVGGLYTFTPAGDRLHAESEGGSTLEGELTPNDRHTASATVTRLDGEELPLDVSVDGGPGSARYESVRVVFLDSAEGRGQKIRASVRGGSPWSDPDPIP